MEKTYSKRYWLENVKHVCDRDKYEYIVVNIDEDAVTVEFNVTKEQLEEIEEDALCEQQKNNLGSQIPVYSYRTLVNLEKKKRLMDFYGKKGYCILQQDYERCRKEGL